jgi:Spy/CpxP family protein refolding chaperone
MSGRTVLIALFSAGLVIAGVGPSARADDEPKDQKTTAAPPKSDEGGLQFPMLKRFRSAVDELKLSDDQKAKIDKMFDDAKSQLKEARDSANGDRQEIGKKSREVFTKLRDTLMTELTDDQKTELKTKLQTLFTGRGAGGGDVIVRLRTALEKLNLSGDQKRQIKEVLESAETKAKDLREKAQGGDQDAREKLSMVMRDTRQKIGDILTDNQKQQLQDALQGGTPKPKPTENQ